MKRNLRFFFALYAAKLAEAALKLLGRRASYLPGKIAIALCPDFIGRVGKPEKIIAITGTNGKTTCCNLTLSVLQNLGYDVMNNKYGSNVAGGIASSLLSGCSLTGKSKKHLAVFEVDERSSIRVYPYLTPDYLVCTNLFRDSVKRNAHSEYIFDFINTYIPKETKLILNADDNVSSRLGHGNEKKFFGILPGKNETSADENIINDMRLCPECHRELEYTLRRYHHIGRARCPHCGFASPTPDYAADVNLDKLTMTMNIKGKNYTMPLMNEVLFNAYNETAVVALLTEFGIEPDKIIETIASQKIVETRYSSEKIGGIEVISNMAKGQNPVACSCVFDYVRKTPGTKEIIFIIEDAPENVVSSENICYIYATDFEFLNNDNIKRFILAGERALDFKVRMLIAGIPEEKIEIYEDIWSTPKGLKWDCEKIFILHDIHINEDTLVLRDKIKDMLRQRQEGKA